MGITPDNHAAATASAMSQACAPRRDRLAWTAPRPLSVTMADEHLITGEEVSEDLVYGQ